jgi:hypothetical protein
MPLNGPWLIEPLNVDLRERETARVQRPRDASGEHKQLVRVVTA